MFKIDARLFLSGSNSANSAKTLINECKRSISSFSLDTDKNATHFKKSIESCDIDGLIKKIETTKEDLLKVNQSFSEEYLNLLREKLTTVPIDTSKMNAEEKMQYDIKMDAYGRDYNQTLLYKLEKYDELGMLTDEMKQQLQYQRELVAQYDIQDKMYVLDPTTEEYINLFKQCADYDRKLINLNPSLSSKEKASYLKQYETQYNKNLNALKQARQTKLKNEKLEKELEELYASKEKNNGLWHPFVESEIDEAILDKKIEIGEFNPNSPYAATKDEISYKNMNGWDRFWTDTGTFAVSAFTGLYGVTETIEDGLVMLGGKVGICDENWAATHVNKDQKSALYDSIVANSGMNDFSAYSQWHAVGDVAGSTIGYIGMSYAAPWVTATLGGFSAMGSSSQRALNSGASFDEAFGTGAISFGAGFVSGWAIGKFNAFATANTTSMLQVGKNVLIGGGISTLEPIVNSVAEYAIYANDMVDENGNKVYDNIWDYYVDGGGLTNTVMAFGAGGISTGISSFKGLQNYKIKCKNTAVSKFGEEVYDKYKKIIENPKYYDPDKGFIWPQAEGALEYAGMTDAELYKIGTTQGVEGLRQKGAVISVFEEGKVDTRIGESYGEFSGASGDSIKSRALSPNTEFSTAKDLHVYENIDDWTTINQDMIDSAVYGESFTGYSQVADGDKITGIVKVETTAAPWFDSPGGAKQYVYYGVNADGTIATKVLSDGTKQLYKFSMDQLMHMGIIDDITNSVDTSLLDSSLISRLAN